MSRNLSSNNITVLNDVSFSKTLLTLLVLI